ncbi:hypothetical protein H311_01031, partial [Anncaliia algerae PRA109]
ASPKSLSSSSSSDNSIFTEKFFISCSSGIALACIAFAIAGVGKALSNAVDGICAACEIRVEMGNCLIPTSMIGAGLIFAIVIVFTINPEQMTTLDKCSRIIAASLVGSLSIYYGSMAMSAVTKYGMGTNIRQKSFKNVFLIVLVIGELISLFGIMLYFLIANKK